MAEVVVDEMAGGLAAEGSPGLVGWAHESEGEEYEEETEDEVELQKDATSNRVVVEAHQDEEALQETTPHPRSGARSEASHGPY